MSNVRNGINVKVQSPFPANYEVGIPPELPSDGRDVLYFPPRESGQQHLYEAALKFAYPGQKPWHGVFAARSKREEGLTMASTLPDPNSCCISVLGTGYVLNVQRPSDWTSLQLYPVRQSVAIGDSGLLVLSCFTRITAYGREGRRWTTERLCSDQLSIVGIKGRWIDCSGWDASSGQEVFFGVDISSGKLGRAGPALRSL
jgi:hypothetical protein